jgi:tellurite resistance protein
MLNSSDLTAAADIDGPSYLKTIIAVAFADGHVHEEERQFIDMQAQVLSLNSADYWTNPEHDLGFLGGVEMSRPTCMTIIRDCIVLGHLDGDFTETERTKVYDVASLLGRSKSEVDAIETWLKSLWAVMEEGNRLFQQG